jgi:hypothetical protein
MRNQIYGEDEDSGSEAATLLYEFHTNLSKNLEPENSLNNSLEFNKSIKDSYMSKTAGVFIEKFSSIPKSISGLRSNFIPVEILNQNISAQNLGTTDVGGKATYPSDDFSKKESHENAFMRILGMPESSDIGPDEEIFVIDHDFNLRKMKFSLMLSDDSSKSSSGGMDILDERQRSPQDRQFRLTSNDFESISKSLDPKPEVDQSTLGQNVSQQTAEEINAVSINEDHNLLKKVTYLKCLPVQDSRYLRCINEPGKIISKPFDENMIKVVNKEKVKTSFLENIIRLRLDKVSGRIYGDDIDDDSGTKTPISIYDESNINSFSVIEQLLLERLIGMVESLALQYYSLLKNIIFEAKKRKEQDPGIPPKAESDPNQDEINSLKDSLDVIDAIKSILKDTSISSTIFDLTSGQNSDASFQGYIRNSSGFDDEISKSIISIIESESQIYQDALRKKLTPTTKEGRDTGTDGKAVNTIVGTVGTPIGILDIIVYALALFSLNEVSLINLLNKSQKQNLAKILSNDPNSDSLFSSNGFNLTSPVQSINELTIAIYFYYNFFFKNIATDLGSQGRSDLVSGVMEDAEAEPDLKD